MYRVYCNGIEFGIDFATLEDAGFQGDNYISVFWGDSEAQPVRALTPKELAELKDTILTCDID